MKTRLLVAIIGIAMTIIGFGAVFSRSTFFLPPTEPPIMRPVEGIEYVIVVHPQLFLFIGIIGIVIIITGIIIWRKRR